MRRLLPIGFIFVAGAADAARPEGTYELPTADAALKPFAAFMLEKVDLRPHGDEIRLRYDLPEDLTGGKSVRIVLAGTAGADGAVTLAGARATATCQDDGDGGLSGCAMKYKNLPIDAAQADAYLESKYAGAADLAQRKAVFQLFNHEPIGVVRVFRRP